MFLLRGHKRPVRALAYSPDGHVLATGGDDSVIRLWDRATGEALARFDEHEDAVRGLAFDLAGKVFFSGSWDGTIRRWNAERKRGTTVLTHLPPIWSLALSPDGYDMVFSVDKLARVWRLAEPAPHYALEGHAWPITGVTFATGSKHVATVGQDRVVRLWDAYWGRFVADIPPLPDWLHGVAVAPDSRTLALSGGDGIIRLRAVPGLEPVRTFVGHEGDVFGVAFLTGGERLLSAGADGTLRVWEVASGRERRALQLGQGRLFRVAVAPDGMTAAVAAESNDVVLVDLDFDES